MKHKLVMFDMDGTFIDSRNFHTHIFYEFFKKYWKEVPYDKVSSGVGTSVRVLFEIAQISEDLMEPYFRRLDEFYENESLEMIKKIKLADGIKELLENLKERGVKRAVVTNSLQSVADEILRVHGLSDKFDLVLGADMYSKDKIQRCRIIEERLGVASSGILFVGDSEEDMMLANTMGYQGCFLDTRIAWYKDKEYILSELKPAYVVDSIKQVAELAYN